MAPQTPELRHAVVWSKKRESKGTRALSLMLPGPLTEFHPLISVLSQDLNLFLFDSKALPDF